MLARFFLRTPNWEKVLLVFFWICIDHWENWKGDILIVSFLENMDAPDFFGEDSMRSSDFTKGEKICFQNLQMVQQNWKGEITNSENSLFSGNEEWKFQWTNKLKANREKFHSTESKDDVDYRHHIAFRVQFHVPKEETFTIFWSTMTQQGPFTGNHIRKTHWFFRVYKIYPIERRARITCGFKYGPTWARQRRKKKGRHYRREAEIRERSEWKGMEIIDLNRKIVGIIAHLETDVQFPLLEFAVSTPMVVSVLLCVCFCVVQWTIETLHFLVQVFCGRERERNILCCFKQSWDR